MPDRDPTATSAPDRTLFVGQQHDDPVAKETNLALTQYPQTHLIVANWGLSGSATSGKPGYRSQNPWQALEHYMERNRGDAQQVFQSHGATATRIDSGGSVWRVELSSIPTAGGLTVEQFSKLLVEKLASQNPAPEPADRIIVSYADSTEVGAWEWKP